MASLGRLLIATPLYPPDPGGPATYSRLIEEGLPGQGIETEVVSFGDTRRLPKLVRHLAYLARLMRAGKHADLLYALDPVSTGLPTLIAARILRKPLALKIVGDYAWEQGRQRFGVRETLDEFVRTHQRSFAVSWLQRIQAFVATRADAIIVPSAYLKRIITAWGVPAERITVVFNALPDIAPGAVPEETKALPRPRIATVGRLVPWKGVGGLIDAMVIVRERIPEAALVIAGDGPDRASLEAYAAARLKDGYTFTGALLPEDVHALLASVDAFALNSTYEGLSHLLIEAAGLGTPTVATRVGGNGEVIEDGVDGLLVPSGDAPALADAIIRLVTDTDLAFRLSAASRGRSVRFSKETMLARLVPVLSAAV